MSNDPIELRAGHPIEATVTRIEPYGLFLEHQGASIFVEQSRIPRKRVEAGNSRRDEDLRDAFLACQVVVTRVLRRASRFPYYIGTMETEPSATTCALDGLTVEATIARTEPFGLFLDYRGDEIFVHLPSIPRIWDGPGGVIPPDIYSVGERERVRVFRFVPSRSDYWGSMRGLSAPRPLRVNAHVTFLAGPEDAQGATRDSGTTPLLRVSDERLLPCVVWGESETRSFEPGVEYAVELEPVLWGTSRTEELADTTFELYEDGDVVARGRAAASLVVL